MFIDWIAFLFSNALMDIKFVRLQELPSEESSILATYCDISVSTGVKL